jgi:hypothetical protein
MTDDEMSNTMIGIFKKLSTVAKKLGYSDVSVEKYLYYDEYESETCDFKLYRGKIAKRCSIASFRDSVGHKIYCKQGNLSLNKEDFLDIVRACLPITANRL